MANAPPDRRIFRFGIFELDCASGVLRKEGKEQPRLRDQALRILLMLLERPRDVVTREDLRARLWSADTFVDFDHGMNSAINQLRNALGDTAASPRFIQTLPRRGYRFIAPVETVEDAKEGRSASSDVTPSANSGASTLGDGSLSSDATPVRNLGSGTLGGRSPSSEITPDLASGVSTLGGRSLSSDIIASASGVSTPEDSEAASSSRLLSDEHDLPPAPRSVVRILFSLIQLMYLIFYIVSLARLTKVESILSEVSPRSFWILVLLIVTAAIGIPVRLYLLAATAFNYARLKSKFLKLFPFLFPLDEIWALAPFLLVHQTGIGLAIAMTAALLYVPFAQRSLLLMGFPGRQNRSVH